MNDNKDFSHNQNTFHTFSNRYKRKMRKMIRNYENDKYSEKRRNTIIRKPAFLYTFIICLIVISVFSFWKSPLNTMAQIALFKFKTGSNISISDNINGPYKECISINTVQFAKYELIKAIERADYYKRKYKNCDIATYYEEVPQMYRDLSDKLNSVDYNCKLTLASPFTSYIPESPNEEMTYFVIFHNTTPLFIVSITDTGSEKIFMYDKKYDSILTKLKTNNDYIFYTIKGITYAESSTEVTKIFSGNHSIQRNIDENKLNKFINLSYLQKKKIIMNHIKYNTDLFMDVSFPDDNDDNKIKINTLHTNKARNKHLTIFIFLAVVLGFIIYLYISEKKRIMKK